MHRSRTWSIALAVAVVGCTGGQTTDDTLPPVSTSAVDAFERYESSEYGIAIDYPTGWVVTEVEAENLVGFTAPQSPDSLAPNFNITVTEVSDDLPAVAYYEGEIERVETSLENAEILEVANVDVDGVVGRGLTLVTRQSGLDIGISRIIVLADARAYEISFFALAADLEELAPVVTAIFRSIELLD